EAPPAAATAPATETAQPAAGAEETVWASKPVVVASCCDEPKTLDPAVAIDIPGTQLINAGYEGLTTYNRQGTIEPMLAASWQISDDAKSYTFKLREGVKFHDGSDFNADAVKVSFDRMKAMGLGASFFLNAVEEVKVLDDMTVQITLSEPDIQFWYGLPRIKIVSAEAVKAHEKDGDWAQDFFRENIVGTGAYRLDEWERGRQIRMVAFDDYRKGWAGKHVKEFVVRYSLDMPTKMLLLEQGEVHLIDAVGLSEVKRAANNPDIRIGASDVFRGYYHTVNNQHEFLKDKKVRQAILLAFPYNAMIDVMEGYATPLTSPATSNMIGHCDVFTPTEDLEQAKALLAEAGHPDGGFELTMDYLPGLEPERLSSQLFQENLATLGVDLKLQEVEWGTLLEAQKQVDTAPDFAALYVTSPVPYAGAQLFRLGHSSIQGSSYNWQFYDNPEFDQLIEEAQRRLPDDPERDDLLCQAQRLFMDDAAILPVMNQQNLDLSRKELAGYQFDPYSYVQDLHMYDLFLEQ
ncbi:MAG TPA: hypothetical protein DEP84_32615, partial [Chloroflexi bacterium]|nr:hypothetical protein [Chloroflexota bacterium]